MVRWRGSLPALLPRPRAATQPCLQRPPPTGDGHEVHKALAAQRNLAHALLQAGWGVCNAGVGHAGQALGAASIGRRSSSPTAGPAAPPVPAGTAAAHG